jgi:type I restriction enzyme S subunit
VTERDGWKSVQLRDHVDLLAGFPFKSARYTDDASDVKLLRGDNVGQGTLRWDAARRWATSEIETYARFCLQPGDVILAMDRPWIEAGLKWAWVRGPDPPCLLVQRVARLRGSDGLLTTYLRYVIGSIAFSDYIQPIVTGVNVPHISASQIGGFEFKLPPVSVQRKIAAILSPYDDLIENNTRRIAILESMARLLFREWFVEFRFPGHQSVRMVDSRLGPIPEDWLTVPIGELVTLWRDNVNPRRMPEVAVDHYSFKAFDEGQLPIAENGAAIQSGKLRMPGECVLLAKLNPRIQRVWHAVPSGEREPVASGEFLVMTPRQESSIPFIFELCSSPDFLARYASLSIGTSGSHQRVKASDALNLPVVLPPPSVVAKFCHIVGPMLSLIYLLRRAGRPLKHTRDLLLPLLVSGELDVGDLDILVEDAAA